MFRGGSRLPAAPWSVPLSPFSAARRPNSDQTCTRTRSARPRASRSRWNASSESEVSWSPSVRAVGSSACVSYSPGAVSATQWSGRPAVKHRGKPSEPLRERVARLRIRHRARDLRRLERDQLPAQAVHLRCDVAGRPQPGVRGLVAHQADRLEHPLLDLAPDSLAVEVVLVGARDRRDRNLGGREGRGERVVERESLERVVLLADLVEVPPEPAGAKRGHRRPDLPVVAGGEVRLVGVRVADGGQHRHLLLRVELLRARRAPDASRGGRPRRTAFRRRARAAGAASCRAGRPAVTARRGRRHRPRGRWRRELARPARKLQRRSPPRTHAARAGSRRRRRARRRGSWRGSGAG